MILGKTVKLELHVEQVPGGYQAVDWLTYDADCDSEGYFNVGPVGSGSTPEEAVCSLLEQLEEWYSED